MLFCTTWTFEKSFAVENLSFDVKLKKNEQNTSESWN